MGDGRRLRTEQALYPAAPFSSLYLFGRKQDVGFQKAPEVQAFAFLVPPYLADDARPFQLAKDEIALCVGVGIACVRATPKAPTAGCNRWANRGGERCLPR
jgi:hypothetical protein